MVVQLQKYYGGEILGEAEGDGTNNERKRKSDRLNQRMEEKKGLKQQMRDIQPNETNEHRTFHMNKQSSLY